jgi:hypothetical protein
MSCLFALVAVSIIGLFFPMGSAFQLLLAFFGAVLFSACARPHSFCRSARVQHPCVRTCS